MVSRNNISNLLSKVYNKGGCFIQLLNPWLIANFPLQKNYEQTSAIRKLMATVVYYMKLCSDVKASSMKFLISLISCPSKEGKEQFKFNISPI